MSEPKTFKQHTADLEIRSRPRPVTRMNRKVLLAGAGLGVIGLFAAANLALKPASPASAEPSKPVYTKQAKRTPEGLSALPASYDAPGFQTAEPVIPLGAPLPGDLGSTILASELAAGVPVIPATEFETSFKPNAEDEAERARRLRQAKLQEEATLAPLFFQLSTRTASPQPARPADPMAAINSELLALAAGGFGPHQEHASRPDANLQQAKLDFAQDRYASETLNPDPLQPAASPYALMAGTLIPASLVTGINSDLPGTIIAQVTQPVYDTATGTHLLIPQGSRLLGRYQSQVSFGQNRALVTWDRILFPDASSILISAPGSDRLGYAGLSDRTDHHWDRVFLAAGLATVLGIGAEVGRDNEDEIARAIRDGTADTVNEAGERVVEGNLDIQPTIRIRPGWPVRVIVTQDLILKPYSETLNVAPPR
ncbi:MAG: TrbI/VirB10 family protein [Henriciella sp.]|uniref:TrbI/VirB10 family protein n=1 Tax=Henriciella sp. TaxID=1968823 RepID=UPI003C751840